MTASKIAAPLLGALIIFIIGAVGFWAQQPWLVPSLGSAVFSQVTSPEHPSASPYSIGLGQLIGIAAAFAGIYILGAEHAPALMTGHPVVWTRVGAAALAILIALALQIGSKAMSPAGGATALVLAVGAEVPTAGGALRMVIGILLVILFGEAARRLALRLRTAGRTRTVTRVA